MRVVVDPESGFCFGVEYAVAVAEALLESEPVVYCLGDIVHNDLEVARLRRMGLRTITHEELRTLQNATVLIRAHGEPPETYAIARQNNLTLVDASCPVVLKLQNRVKQAHDAGYQVVIYGKIDHPEVRGLVGQTGGSALVIRSEEDLEQIDWGRPVALFSQTTKSLEAYSACALWWKLGSRRRRPSIRSAARFPIAISTWLNSPDSTTWSFSWPAGKAPTVGCSMKFAGRTTSARISSKARRIWTPHGSRGPNR